MKKILISSIFLLGAPAALLLSFLFLQRVDIPAQTPPLPVKVLAAETAVTPSLSGRASVADGRAIIIKNYLSQYTSPLEPYSQLIVDISDKYHLDYRLLVAIAQQESNLCKKIPVGSYNCWGFGIYGDLVTRFDNYPEGLEMVAQTLKKQYIDQGLTTPEQIMAKYTPPSVDIGGPWAKGVNKFLIDLQ